MSVAYNLSWEHIQVLPQHICRWVGATGENADTAEGKSGRVCAKNINSHLFYEIVLVYSHPRINMAMKNVD